MNKEKKKQISFIEDCYRLYENKMYYVAYGILHDEGLAEDAVQDAFLRLMKHEVHFTSAESDDCKRYIITVIRNASINIYNKKKRESELESFIFSLMEKTMKQALDAALDDIFKDWK